MNISAPFVERPVATTLLTLAIVLAGAVRSEEHTSELSHG